MFVVFWFLVLVGQFDPDRFVARVVVLGPFWNDSRMILCIVTRLQTSFPNERTINGHQNTPRTTMDAVPLKFVDSAVELFSKKTLDELAPEARHPLWKDVVDLHHRNRIYFGVRIGKDEDGTEQATITRDGKADLSASARTIRKNLRFARIGYIGKFPTIYFDEIEKRGKAGTEQLLKTIAPLIDPGLHSFLSIWNSSDFTRVLLTSLFQRVYLKQITVEYCGQIAFDFLEDQINNSPFLTKVDITGYNWPQSSAELLKKFCLKGRPGKRVQALLSFKGKAIIDSKYIQDLFDLWKANGNLDFKLYSSGIIVDREICLASMNIFQVIEWCSWRFFKHETEKSIARVSDNAIECFTCECDQFEKCILKEECPHYHDF
uniref:F-box domain-containing protein n=1 Tax=Steinernema glaseri TaxID=37863 RepID=A0A1I7YFS5_9BILA